MLPGGRRQAAPAAAAFASQLVHPLRTLLLPEFGGLLYQHPSPSTVLMRASWLRKQAAPSSGRQAAARRRGAAGSL